MVLKIIFLLFFMLMKKNHEKLKIIYFKISKIFKKKNLSNIIYAQKKATENVFKKKKNSI